VSADAAFRTLLRQLRAENRDAQDELLLAPEAARPPAARSPARFVVRIAPEAVGDESETPAPLRPVEGTIAGPPGATPERVTAEPLFPGADPESRLARYWLITAPLRRAECGAGGHDLAYALRELDGCESAYYEDVYGAFAPLGAGGKVPVATDHPRDDAIPRWSDRGWSAKTVRADEDALALGKGGEGVVIGHPDTGWHTHPELDPEALDLERARSVTWLDGGRSAVDPLRDVPGFFPGHGTSTGSVLVSRHAPATDVLGIAPRARLIPIRCADTVVSVSGVNISRAIHYAIAQGVDVISMSLGGFPTRHLEEALKNAVYGHDVIVCCAAGNQVGITVFPASYPECIAVAACTSANRPWKLSSHGRAVDIVAPGSRVWAADFDKDRGDAPVVIAGGGTSYATPHVAGAAALWIARHGGRAALRARYGGEASLQEVFRHLLKTTAHVPDRFLDPHEREESLPPRDPDQWDHAEYGPGILDVTALLAAPLPTVAEVQPVPKAARFDPMPLERVLDVIFPGRSGDEVVAEVAAQVRAAGLDEEETIRALAPELSRISMSLGTEPRGSVVDTLFERASGRLRALLR
jgi:subtilisin family serine protease